MKEKNVITTLVSGLLLTAGITAVVAEPEQIQTQDQVRDRIQVQQSGTYGDRIHGSDLMTPQERAEYQSNMRNMKTQQERDAYRLEHHKRMQERARERGLELPDTPPPQGGKGMGAGGGGRGR